MTPDLSRFRWIVVNSSGGKDSMTSLRAVVQECDRRGIPRSRIVISHQLLGEMEWPGTFELISQHAAHYGLRLETSAYRSKTGTTPTLLEYIKARGKWPDSKNRYCTSEFKRGPGGRILVKLYREAQGEILNVYGFRAQESPARALKKPLALNTRFSTKSRQVSDWLPILEWNEDNVWADIKASRVPYHYAYDLGMSRLSCCFCVFASRKDLAISARANPKLFADYCRTEKAIQHTFQHGKPLSISAPGK